MSVNSVSNATRLSDQLERLARSGQSSQSTELDGKAIGAIMQFLSALAAGDSAGTCASDTAPSPDSSSSSGSTAPTQALAPFAQSLVPTLQTRNARSPSCNTSGGASSVSEVGLRSAQVRASLTGVTQKTCARSAASSGAGPMVNVLESRFQNSASALGESSSDSATLSEFPQTPADNMAGASSAGGGVSPQA